VAYAKRDKVAEEAAARLESGATHQTTSRDSISPC